MMATRTLTEMAIQTWVLTAFSEVPARADVQVGNPQIPRNTLSLQSLKDESATNNRTAVTPTPISELLAFGFSGRDPRSAKAPGAENTR